MISHKSIGYNGRFGNQLFQFASTIGIAKKIGADVRFPAQNSNGVTQTLKDGKSFSAQIDILECFDIDSFFGDIPNYPSKSESHFHFDESLFTIPDDTIVDGYLQSWRYFAHCEDYIRETLKIKESILNKAREIVGSDPYNLTSIHVRRGDYIVQPEFHPFCGLDYLNSCIRKLKGKFIVCSDDIMWCKQNLSGDINFVESGSMFVDFACLSLCKNHIISNSSYSWWSSFLSDYPDKMIFAPKRWFGDAYANLYTGDLYHPSMKAV